ncbi:MAG TPA: TIGR00153 family protein [Deltaproteobacteria bacterium]|nr:TIGR00153 family protein [Deltaproteobacteria bacterium]
MRVVRRCAEHVVPLADALIAGDDETLRAEAKAIFTLEAEADVLKNELRMRLPRSLFLPVDRRDLLDVLHVQDSIADTAEDIAGLMIRRDMRPPEPMRPILAALCRRCVEVVGLCGDVIEHFDELIEVGFRGRVAEQVETLTSRLNEAEDDTDALGRQLTSELFALEDQMSPVSVMFTYQLIEWIGDLADHAEKVGNNVRLLIAR